MLGMCGEFQTISNFKSSPTVQLRTRHRVKSDQLYSYSACTLNIATAFMSYLDSKLAHDLASKGRTWPCLQEVAYDLGFTRSHTTSLPQGHTRHSLSYKVTRGFILVKGQVVAHTKSPLEMSTCDITSQTTTDRRRHPIIDDINFQATLNHSRHLVAHDSMSHNIMLHQKTYHTRHYVAYDNMSHMTSLP